MIVTMNKNNSDKYLNLFTEAYEYLKGLNKGYVDINKERFSSLAEYYSHMADFFENQKYKYIMLPLDEASFDIDLNTRIINVPASFSKCASVQTDQLAETIVFVTDRYFDYMDLANTEIYVQWTIPEDKKNNIAEYNGATRVEMIDLESMPGKLKFAWPLNDKITAVPGTVKFSVRFFRLDDSSPNKLLYSLNTMDAAFTIKPALQPNLNEESKVESPVSDNSFKKAILNSIYAEEGVIPPVMPEFFEPGSNIQATTEMIEVGDIKVASLDKNDTVTLSVQAVVADAGEITYKWYYKDKSGVYYDCENYPVYDADGEIISYAPFGEVKDEYRVIDPKPTEKVTNERYYYSPSVGVYDLYTGDFPPSKDLFERYSTFKVPTTGNITGEYQAAAWNTVISKGKTLTTLNPRRSDVCLLPGPADVAFKTNGDLTKGVLLNYNSNNETYEALLKVELKADDYQPSIAYEWRKSTNAPADVLDATKDAFETTNTASKTVSEVGWYSVRAASTLNRETKYKFSEVCKVTLPPKPPVVVSQENTLVSVKKAPTTFTISADVNNPDNINKELLTDSVKDNKITSFDYIWQILLPDTSDFITIPDDYVGVEGLHTNALTVNNKLKTSSASFRCLVVNNLNNAKAVFDHSGVYNSNGELGAFENKAPYVYENVDDSFVFTVINY